MKTHPDVQFLALSVSDAPDDVIATIRAGRAGLRHANDRADELIDAIADARATATRCFSPRLAGFVLDAFAEAAPPATDPGLEQLRPANVRCCDLIAGGTRTRRSARDLGISVKTVETHVSSVLRKLQLSSRHQFAALGQRPPPDQSPFVRPVRPGPNCRHKPPSTTPCLV